MVSIPFHHETHLGNKKGSFHGAVKTALGREDAQMAVEEASIIPVCSFLKGKRLAFIRKQAFLTSHWWR